MFGLFVFVGSVCVDVVYVRCICVWCVYVCGVVCVYECGLLMCVGVCLSVLCVFGVCVGV